MILLMDWKSRIRVEVKPIWRVLNTPMKHVGRVAHSREDLNPSFSTNIETMGSF